MSIVYVSHVSQRSGISTAPSPGTSAPTSAAPRRPGCRTRPRPPPPKRMERAAGFSPWEKPWESRKRPGKLVGKLGKSAEHCGKTMGKSWKIIRKLGKHWTVTKRWGLLHLVHLSSWTNLVPAEDLSYHRIFFAFHAFLAVSCGWEHQIVAPTAKALATQLEMREGHNVF